MNLAATTALKLSDVITFKMKLISHLLLLLGLVTPNVAVRLNEDTLFISRNVRIARGISDCTGEAAKALFTPSNDITVVVANRFRHPHLLQDMLGTTFVDRAVKVFNNVRTDPNDNEHVSSRESSFVLIETHVDGHQLLDDPLIERWAEYIIVTKSSFQWLTKFADQLWHLGYVKVAFVRVSSTGSSTLLRPTQSPQSRGSIPTLESFDLCRETSKPDKSSTERTQGVSTTAHPFSSLLHTPTKGTLEFAKVLEKGKTFTRFTSDGRRTSLGIDILQMFATKYNIEMVRNDWKTEDDLVMTWMDAMQRCVAGKCDFFYARELPPKNCCDRVEPIGWYTLETLVFVDSRKSSLRTLSGLLMPYHGFVWLCTFLLLGTFALFAWAIEILWSQSLVHERITVLQICSIFVGQPIPVLPAKFSLRFVIGMWLVYNLNSILLYTGTFSSALTTYDTDMLTTVDDILESGRPICGTKHAQRILNSTKMSEIHRIRDRLEIVSEEEIFDKILNENYIGAHHSSYVSLHNWINRANSSLQLYRISEAFIAKYPLNIFAKKRNPFNDAFNRMISNLREAGVNAYLVDRFYNHRFAKSGEEKPLLTTGGPYLTLEHLQVVFYILFAGHLLSSIVFLVEIHMPR